MKTPIKPKFVNRFSLKILGPAVDPGIGVHWKFFKLSNVGVELSKYGSAVIDLAKLLPWDFLLPRVKHNVKYPCSTQEFTALFCSP